jgi:PQQ-dependent dehydrogenase (methanol/ethanol family)
MLASRSLAGEIRSTRACLAGTLRANGTPLEDESRFIAQVGHIAGNVMTRDWLKDHRTRRVLGRTGVCCLLLLAACKPQSSHSTGSRSASIGQAPAGGDIGIAPDDGEWVRPAKDYASTRFSGLTEITPQNVKNLRAVFTFSTGTVRGHEAAPIVANNTMYVVTPYPNYVYALDLTKPGAPAKWTYQPKPRSAAQGVACCDVVNRGVVYDNGRIFLNTLDGNTIAIDGNTGKEIWRTQVAEINIGETVTMAPLVVKGKVLVGNSGGEMGVRGWLKALDAGSGRLVWTAYHTGPDADVLIGPAFKPFYPRDRGKDLGANSWPPDAWKIGGGTMWGWISYDPALDLIFYGTANPGPWNPDQRPGDNKWTSTLFARRPDNGEAVWAYQLTPHDQHDYDGINEQILIDMPWQGSTRKVLVRPERNGYVYVVDRTNGQVLSAEPFGFVNTSTGVDLRTGELKVNPDKSPRLGQVVREMCPAAPGMKDWQPSAYSPQTGLLYIPHQNLCMDVEGLEANYIAGTPYVGANVKMYAGPGGNRGEFEAWNPQTGKKVWGIPEDLPVWSGALVTAGGVAFYGTMDGWFKAVDARTGAPLWQFKTGSGIIGQPISYRGPDGHQYIAVLSGVGGWAGAIVVGNLDWRDSSAALGMVNAMKDLPDKTSKGGMLYVFGL